jgi:hypothetical protein
MVRNNCYPLVRPAPTKYMASRTKEIQPTPQQQGTTNSHWRATHSSDCSSSANITLDEECLAVFKAWHCLNLDRKRMLTHKTKMLVHRQCKTEKVQYILQMNS